MTQWRQVLQQAERESERVTDFQRLDSPGIEDFYPEIRSSEIQFTNTLGSNLLPDLLTSEGVVVDLYDWDSPGDLIAKYGVDLAFLLRLRDAGVVVLCANLEPERYARAEWLHGVLADQRTIFRSLRTPAFFSAIDPAFARRRAATKDALRAAFERFDNATSQALIAAMAAAHAPTNIEHATHALSMWIERLAVFEPEESRVLAQRIMGRDTEAVRDLHRWHRLAVSPHSGWLGGEAKTPYESWRSLFPDRNDEVAGSDLLRFESILSWMSEARLGATSNDFKAADWWARLSEAQANTLLANLADVSTRRELIEAESILRHALVSPSEGAPTRQAIDSYVSKAKEETEKLQRWAPGLPAAIGGAFGCLGDQCLAGAAIGWATWLACERFGSPNARRLAEAVWPKLRLVRLVSSE